MGISMKTPEGYEKSAIDTYLKKIGAYVVNPMTFGYGKSGNSDRIGCYKGFFFSIEVKRPDKVPTAIQYRRMAEVTTAGGKAFWGTADKVIPEIEIWRRELVNESLKFPWERA